MSVDQELIADALPAYEIGDVLGRGGWGVVLSGRHRHLDRRVAIKQLPAAFAADPATRRRFTSEARVLASLDHPHVVQVFDYVERDNLCLLVMELLPGGTVRGRSIDEGFTAPSSIAVALACAAGLSAAHSRGVLHRDVKPENMLFAASGAVKVTDFGIAKVIGGAGTVMTRAGDVLGTPAYIAPEQVRGGELSPATDVYGLSTMLYEMLAGVLPFADDGDAMALLFKHAYEPPKPLQEVTDAVTDEVAAVVMQALSTDPADRFDTAEIFGVALAEASVAAWGPGWLSAGGVPVMSSGPILAAAGQSSGGPMSSWPVTTEPVRSARRGATDGSPVPVPAASPGAAPTTRRPGTTTAPPVVPTDTVQVPSIEPETATADALPALHSPTLSSESVTVATQRAAETAVPASVTATPHDPPRPDGNEPGGAGDAVEPPRAGRYTRRILLGAAAVVVVLAGILVIPRLAAGYTLAPTNSTSDLTSTASLSPQPSATSVPRSAAPSSTESAAARAPLTTTRSRRPVAPAAPLTSVARPTVRPTSQSPPTSSAPGVRSSSSPASAPLTSAGDSPTPLTRSAALSTDSAPGG